MKHHKNGHPHHHSPHHEDHHEHHVREHEGHASHLKHAHKGSHALNSGITDQGNPMEAASFAEAARHRPAGHRVPTAPGPVAEPMKLNGVPLVKSGGLSGK